VCQQAFAMHSAEQNRTVCVYLRAERRILARARQRHAHALLSSPRRRSGRGRRLLLQREEEVGGGGGGHRRAAKAGGAAELNLVRIVVRSCLRVLLRHARSSSKSAKRNETKRNEPKRNETKRCDVSKAGQDSTSRCPLGSGKGQGRRGPHRCLPACVVVREHPVPIP
jgi:hypothetical protein